MNSRFGKVGVLYGGQSGEREVSLMSGQGVHEALVKAGVDAHLFDTGRQSLAELAQAGFDRVFIALHGRHGEDGTMQGALELLGIPYTGSGPLASALAMDKIMTKRIWIEQGIPTPAYAEVRNAGELDDVASRLGLPMILKAPHEGSTLGLARVEQADALVQAWQQVVRYESVALAEQFIRGRELTIAVLGRGEQARALPIIEIIAPQGNYDYEHKYFSDDTRYECPASLPADLAAEIQALCVRAYRVLGCEGWGRVDVMLDEQQRPWLLEINTSPGMTGHSLVPMASRAEGVDYTQLCLNILAEASCKVPLNPAQPA
ncbi:D-alanine--D-alanine ligase [Alcaligenaceae bacterium SJ-26]|nr:D-alanine--D-alanine ligase [Alcaligenaceae bacterium SJ-26]